MAWGTSWDQTRTVDHWKLSDLEESCVAAVQCHCGSRLAKNAVPRQHSPQSLKAFHQPGIKWIYNGSLLRWWKQLTLTVATRKGFLHPPLPITVFFEKEIIKFQNKGLKWGVVHKWRQHVFPFFWTSFPHSSHSVTHTTTPEKRISQIRFPAATLNY